MSEHTMFFGLNCTFLELFCTPIFKSINIFAKYTLQFYNSLSRKNTNSDTHINTKNNQCQLKPI